MGTPDRHDPIDDFDARDITALDVPLEVADELPPMRRGAQMCPNKMRVMHVARSVPGKWVRYVRMDFAPASVGEQRSFKERGYQCAMRNTFHDGKTTRGDLWVRWPLPNQLDEVTSDG